MKTKEELLAIATKSDEELQVYHIDREIRTAKELGHMYLIYKAMSGDWDAQQCILFEEAEGLVHTQSFSAFLRLNAQAIIKRSKDA